MSERNDRYSRNRHTWRKVYPYTNRKPNRVSVFDDGRNESLTIDLSRISRHRDIFHIENPGVFYAVYEEGLITFNGETEVFGSYACKFFSTPQVTFTMETDDSQSNVNVFGRFRPTATSFKIGTSAPFVGTVRYRASSLPSAESAYPLWINDETKCVGTTSSSFWLYSGIASRSADLMEFTASYTLPSGSLEIRVEAHDVNDNKGSDVAFEIDTLTTSSATGRISAPLNDNIHFIVTSQ